MYIYSSIIPQLLFPYFYILAIKCYIFMCKNYVFVYRLCNEIGKKERVGDTIYQGIKYRDVTKTGRNKKRAEKR